MDTGPNPSGHPKLTLALSKQGMMIPKFGGSKASTLTFALSSQEDQHASGLYSGVTILEAQMLYRPVTNKPFY